MSTSDLRLDELSAALLDAISGAAAVIDAQRRVLAANDAWTKDGLAPIGTILRSDDPIGAAVDRAAGGPSFVPVMVGSMPCRARVQEMVRGLTLVQVDIESDSDERAQLGEAMVRVLRQFPVVYFRFNDDGTLTESLGAGLETLGLVDREAVGINVFEAYPQVAEENRRAMLGENVSFLAEGELDGRRWAFRTYTSPDRERGSGGIGIALDVTEQFEAKEALLASEALLREVADQVPGVVYCYDSMPDGTRKTLFMGSGLESLLGEQIAEQVVESPTALFDRIAPEGLAQIRQVGPRSIDLQIPIDLEYEMRTDDGRWIWVRNVVRSIRQPDGSVRNTGVLMDVTTKRRALTALRQSRELLDRTQRIADIGGWKHDLLTDEVAWTDQVRVILGLAPNEFPSIDLLLHLCDQRSANELRTARERAITTGEPWDIELTLHRDEDDRRIIRLTGTTEIENGRPIMLWGTIQDVTRQRALELELRHAQKMEAVGQLASGIAHEFNNLISTISGHVDIAQQALAPESLATESLEQVAEAMERAFGLARSLLAFSRKSAPRREIVDIGMIIDQAERLLRRTMTKRLELDIKAKFGLWTSADAAQILQVVLNLAINARDAMPHGGTLIIAVDSHDDDVLIRVSDTGEGIPESIMRRIFEPFFTTKPSDLGTGLGLALSRGIIEDHGGSIQVTSAVGQGSTFTVRLPKARPAQRRPEPKRRSAVLAESQPFARSLLTTLLGELGFEVAAVDSAESALGSAENADLIVISTYAGTELPNIQPGPNVILITGEDPPEDLPEGVSVLRRPFRSSDLTELLEEQVQ